MQKFRVWDVSLHDLPDLMKLTYGIISETLKDDNLCCFNFLNLVCSNKRDGTTTIYLNNDSSVKKEQFYINSSKYRWPTKYDDDIFTLIEDASRRIIDCNLASDSNRGMVEFHSYRIHGSCKSIFDEHEDDYGGVNFKVNTVIYYIKKSSEVDGGDLLINGTVINVRPKKDHYRVVCFAGNISHKVTEMNGNGERVSIVIQLYSLDRS